MRAEILEVGNLTQTAAFQRELLKLGREDQFRVYEALTKLQRDPRAPGLQIKRMERVDLWEIRASRDLRIIAELENDDIFCYSVGHHDEALRRVERVAGMGGPQRAAIRQRANGFTADVATDSDAGVRKASMPRGPLASLSNEDLLRDYSIPIDWCEALRSMTTQDQVFASGVDSAMPEAAFWRLLDLFDRPRHESTGASPVYRIPSEAIARAFVAGEIADLEFNLPASSWSIVRGTRRAPIFVKGGPGSGKTLVALYRALHVIEEPTLRVAGDPRVLYVTFTRQLRDDARNKVERLRGSIPASLRIETFDAIGERLVPGVRTTYDAATLERCARAALAGTSINPTFFLDEVSECIERRNVRAPDDYARLARRGRGARLIPRERAAIWSAYERYLTELARGRERDVGTMRMQAADRAAALSEAEKYDFVIVDEVQDLPWSMLSLAAALARGEGRAKHLMLVGDSGQSIYQSGFRWSEVGLRIGGGNVFTLGTSERNTREILAFSRAVIEAVPTDDAQTETAVKTGLRPRLVHGFENVDQRREWLAADIAARIGSGAASHGIAVVAHGKNELKALAGELADRGVATVEYNSPEFYRAAAVRLITAHSAKGLEFAEVYVPDANAGTYPFYKNVQLPPDERDDRDAQDCKLLYVALTRAAERLTVLYDREPSPFLAKAAPHADVTVITPSTVQTRA